MDVGRAEAAGAHAGVGQPADQAVADDVQARSMNVRPPCSSFSARWPVSAMISPRSGQGLNRHEMRKKRSSFVSDHSSRRIASRVLPPLRMM